MAPILLVSILPVYSGVNTHERMGAMPLYLKIILARANVYSRASATLHLSGTVPATLDGECYPKTVYAVVESPTLTTGNSTQ